MLKIGEKVKYIYRGYLSDFLIMSRTEQNKNMRTGTVESILITSTGTSYKIRYGKESWNFDTVENEDLVFNIEKPYDEIIAKVRELVLKQFEKDVNAYNKDHKTEGYNSKVVSDVDWRLNDEANALALGVVDR